MTEIVFLVEDDPDSGLTVPAHDPIKIGTLNAILRDVADHLIPVLLLLTRKKKRFA